MSYHDLTLKDIAHHTQNAVSTVGTWKQGRIPASAETITRLAEIFQVSESFLRDGVARKKDIASQPNRAERILKDIDALLAELNAESRERIDSVVEESQSTYNQNTARTRTGTRRDIETYFQEFLEEAESDPDGLAYAWYHLRREFPKGLYRQIRSRT